MRPRTLEILIRIMMLRGWCFDTEVTRSTCMGSPTLVGWSHSKFIMLQTRYTPVFNYVVYSNKNKKTFIVFTRKRFYLRKNFYAATIDGTYFSETFDEKVLAIHSSLTCLLRDFNSSNTFIIRVAEFSFFKGKYFWDKKEGWLFSWKKGWIGVMWGVEKITLCGIQVVRLLLNSIFLQRLCHYFRKS